MVRVWDSKLTVYIPAQGPESVLDGDLIAFIADHQERTNGGDLPEKEQPEQVIGKAHAEHG